MNPITVPHPVHEPQPVTGKRGRPRVDVDATPDVYRNARFARFQAVQLLEGVLYDGIQRIAAGAHVPGDRPGRDLRAQLRSLTRKLAAALGVEPRDFERRVVSLTLPAPAELRKVGQKLAGELTGQLLGHGRTWFRDQIRSAPKEWRPGKRRRFATDQQIRNERRNHPGCFEHFTRAEQMFYGFPREAQQAIESAVREAVAREVASPHAAVFEMFNYLHGSAELRGILPPPEPLRRAVRAAIKGLPLKVLREVNSRTIHSGPYRVTPLPALGPPRQWMRTPRMAKREAGHPRAAARQPSGSPTFEEICKLLSWKPMRAQEILRRLAACSDARDVLRVALETGEIVQVAPGDDDDDRLMLAA